MADPVATMEKIVKIGLKIKVAVDTVRLNQEECNEIRKRVLRFSAILSQLQQTGMMNDSPAMSGALEDLEETLQHALELVTACQETSTIRRLIKAGDLSKQLRQVKEDILNKVMLASFAINTHTTVVLLTIQAGGQPQLRQSQDLGVVETSTSYSNQSTDDARSATDEVENNILAGSEESFAPLLVALREFRWSELKAATNGFSNGNIIGQGGLFTVYKGVLKDGTTVAIKKGDVTKCLRLKRSCDQHLLIVSKLEHKNVVKFVGYSHEDKSKKDRAKESGFIWVEEYVPNGSLDKMIQGSRDSQLDWSSLYRIIDGVAQGVQYLHEQRVVHMDVKPSNILLDSDMNPIITDFDISIALDDSDEMDADCVDGTRWYADPEYIARGTVSTKNDVYGFGITLTETIGSIRRSRPPPSYYQPVRLAGWLVGWLAESTVGWFFLRENTAGWLAGWLETSQPNRLYIRFPDLWAWEAWEAGQIEEEFDPSLFDGSQLKKIKRCVQIGLLCAQRDREDRPTMMDVLEMLHSEEELPIPKRPSWTRSSRPEVVAAQVLCGLVCHIV